MLNIYSDKMIKMDHEAANQRQVHLTRLKILQYKYILRVIISQKNE